jgi:hypothetical protein
MFLVTWKLIFENSNTDSYCLASAVLANVRQPRLHACSNALMDQRTKQRTDRVTRRTFLPLSGETKRAHAQAATTPLVGWDTTPPRFTPCSHAHYRHRHPAGKDCNPVEMRGDRSCPPLPGSRPRTRVCMRTLLPACVRGVETGEIQYKRGRGDKASTLQRLLVSVDASKQLKRRIEVLGLVAPHGAW